MPAACRTALMTSAVALRGAFAPRAAPEAELFRVRAQEVKFRSIIGANAMSLLALAAAESLHIIGKVSRATVLALLFVEWL